MCGEKEKKILNIVALIVIIEINDLFKTLFLYSHFSHYKETHVSHRSFASDLIDDQVE